MAGYEAPTVLTLVEFDANGRNFKIPDPYPRIFRLTTSLNPIRCQQPNDHFLQTSKVSMQIQRLPVAEHK
ncbi:hypothetical protein D3C73_1491620 [compost metagenome]